MTKPTCGHEKSEGGACGVTFGLCDDCGECFHHCPHRAEARQEAREKGGRATARKLEGKGIHPDEIGPLRSNVDAERWLELIGHAVGQGRLGHREAKVLVQVVDTWVSVHDKGQVTEKLKKLTDALAEWKKTGDPEPVLKLVKAAS